MKSQSGFTLLEVILSIAILTTIVMLTINVLSSEIFLRQKIIERYPFDKVIYRMNKDISGAYISDSLNTNTQIQPNKQINFIHEKSQFSSLFFSVSNHESLIADSKESNIARIGYVVEKNENKNQLIRIIDTQMEELKYIPFPGVGVRTVLVDDVKEFQVKFWKQQEFVDSWDSTTNEQGRLPKMVKIILTLYLPNKQNEKIKQELHLEEIVYVRNSKYKPRADEIEPEEYTWQ